MPSDLSPIVADCPTDELPDRLFRFLRTRFPFPDAPITAGFGEPQEHQQDGAAVLYFLRIEGSGPEATLLFHPALAQESGRLVGAMLVALSEYLIRSQELAAEVPLGTFEVLPIFFGLGPVMANAALHEFSGGLAGIERWDVSRVGRVSSLELGYSMALADWSVGLSHDDVANSMRLDVRDTFRQTLKFLHKTSDCYFDQQIFDDTEKRGIATADVQLRSSISSRILGTLHDLTALSSLPQETAAAIAQHLHHRDEDIQQAAAIALGRCEQLTVAQHDELIMKAEHAPASVRRAAVASLRPGFENDGHVLAVLGDLVGRVDPNSAAVCIRTLLKFDSYPDSLTDAVMTALARMVLTLDASSLQPGVSLLSRLSDEPLALIERHFADDPTALAIFTELLTATASDLGSPQEGS